MEKSYYKFVGVISSLNECPDFVRPVFEKGGKHYFQMGKNGIICFFKEIPKEMRDRIVLLTDINIRENYLVGDNPVICFRIDKNNFFISDIDNFSCFIKNYEAQDYILKEEIDMFIDCVNRKNNAKKKILNNNV